MRLIATLMFLAVFPFEAHAQIPGTQLTVDVTVSSIVLRGDTVEIAYVLYNQPQSLDSLSTFTVDAPATVTNLPRPQPKTKWWVTKTYRGKPVAHWVRLGGLPPSTTSIPLFFESVGLPGIVTHWVVGRFPLPEGEGDDSTSRDPVAENSVIGKTVGVEPFSTDRSPQGLLARLRNLTETSCATPLFWITDSTICSQLINDVDQAESFRSNGQSALAKASLTHYETLLTAGSTTGSVKNPGHWLLKSNSEIIRSEL